MKLKDELMQLRVTAFDDKQRVSKYEQDKEDAISKASELQNEVTILKREIDSLQNKVENQNLELKESKDQILENNYRL